MKRRVWLAAIGAGLCGGLLPGCLLPRTVRPDETGPSPARLAATGERPAAETAEAAPSPYFPQARPPAGQAADAVPAPFRRASYPAPSAEDPGPRDGLTVLPIAEFKPDSLAPANRPAEPAVPPGAATAEAR